MACRHDSCSTDPLEGDSSLPPSTPHMRGVGLNTDSPRGTPTERVRTDVSPRPTFFRSTSFYVYVPYPQLPSSLLFLPLSQYPTYPGGPFVQV